MLMLRAFFERKNWDYLHTLEEEDGERGGHMVNASKRKANIIYCLGDPEMLKSSPMLGSVYSHVKELLRKTPSMYKTMNRRKSAMGRHRHRGRGKGKHKGGMYLRKTPRL